MEAYTVGRFREKQYQLAAQKQNEAHVKYNNYLRTAKYFERECQNARHYDSWNVKDLGAKKHFEDAKKTQSLLIRRNKLKALLKEEEETYRKEVEERRVRKVHSEPPTLEALREKLKEKRAEQSLYLPRTCRTYQSHFVHPTESVRSTTSITLNGTTDLLRSRACRDTTNIPWRSYYPPIQRHPTSMANMNQHAAGIKSGDHSSDNWRRSPDPQEPVSPELPNQKYLERNSRRSLDHTNMRGDDSDDQENMPSRRSDGSAYSAESIRVHFPYQSKEEPHETTEDDQENLKPEEELLNDHEESSNATHSPQDSITIDELDRCKEKIAQAATDLATDIREFEGEKSLPWLRMDPHDKNLSKQMFLYLTHKELKCKIEDLSRREQHACNKHSWDDALRLRDMRNRLELIREKRLYNTDDLDLDEDERTLGFTNIDKREQQLAGRENACTDSTMYSDDAKALWKKWVDEDEQSLITDARSQRETLMQRLEEKWQGLAIKDKEKITDSFRDTNGGFALDEEHKMAGALNTAKTKAAHSR